MSGRGAAPGPGPGSAPGPGQASGQGSAVTASSSGTDPAAVVPGRPDRLPPGARMVLKLGSTSLTRPDGGLDLNRIDIVARLGF